MTTMFVGGPATTGVGHQFVVSSTFMQP